MSESDERADLLVHFRRIPNLLSRAIAEGPDGSLDGKPGNEIALFTHYACGFYLSGTLSFLEGKEGPYCWKEPGLRYSSFDEFAEKTPAPPKRSFSSRGVSNERLDALAALRNAIVHNDGDLAKNHSEGDLARVRNAALPGVAFHGSTVWLRIEFLDVVRIAGLAVRMYYGQR